LLDYLHGLPQRTEGATGSHFRERHLAHPAAKFVLTVREPESWTASFPVT
jgi:hypothetical protein